MLTAIATIAIDAPICVWGTPASRFEALESCAPPLFFVRPPLAAQRPRKETTVRAVRARIKRSRPKPWRRM